MAKWKVSQQESGTKLINFLKEKLGEGYSSRQIKRAIEANACQVNGRTERFASILLGAGDTIILNEEHLSDKPKPKADLTRVLYQDADLLIYNKPSGLPSDGHELSSLGLELVHRLDKETTGVLIFAKNNAARDKMLLLFKEQRIEKSYLAIVDGIPSKKKGVIENHLGKHHEYQGQALWGEVDQDGLYAYTEWQLEGEGKQSSLIRCYPKTGRTHQIRVHMSGMGHPLLGDYQYGRKFKCVYKPGRVMLHAEAVAFAHPTTGEALVVTAELPDDFKVVLKELSISKTQ